MKNHEMQGSEIKYIYLKWTYFNLSTVLLECCNAQDGA